MVVTCRSFAAGIGLGGLIGAMLFGQPAEQQMRIVSNTGVRPGALRSDATVAEVGGGASAEQRQQLERQQLEQQLKEARQSAALAQSETKRVAKELRAAQAKTQTAPVVVHAAAKASNRSDGEQLLAAHRHWDWRSIAKDMMQPWTRIEAAQLETAVGACYDNGTMYCQRMQAEIWSVACLLSCLMPSTVLPKISLFAGSQWLGMVTAVS